MKVIAILCLALVCVSSVAVTPVKKVEISPKGVAQIVEGILAGYFEGEFPITECIQDGEIIIEDIEKAIYLLEQGFSISNIAEAFKYFGFAAVKVPETIKECESCTGIIQDFKNIALIFASPITFLEKVGVNIFWHFRDITNDISRAKDDWKSENYFEFGEFIGKIISMATHRRLAGRFTSAKDVSLIIEGIFLGLFNEKYPVQDCITNADAIWTDIEKIAFYLKQGLTISDIGESFKYIGDAMVQLPKALSNCKNCEGIVQEFKTLNELFTHPLYFLEKSGLNILWHFRDITHDISGAKDAWKNEDYETFGTFIGMMVKIALNTNTPMPQKHIPTVPEFISKIQPAFKNIESFLKKLIN